MYIRLLYREMQKHYKLLIAYIITFFMTLLVFPAALNETSYFDFGSVMAGAASNHFELVWWIWIVIPSVVTSASYWHRECTDFLFLEFTRMKSFRSWFQLKTSFLLLVQFILFIVFGALVYAVFDHLGMTVIIQALNIGFYTLVLINVLILISLFISSISMILISIILFHILFVLYTTFSQEHVLLLTWNQNFSCFNQMLITAITSVIFIIISIIIANPTYLVQKRSERN